MRMIALSLFFAVLGCHSRGDNAGLTQTQAENTMKSGKLSGKKIAILATDGVEQVELTKPRDAFQAQGATTVLIAPKGGTIQGMNHTEKGDGLKVDRTLDSVAASEFDALLLPGGVANPDKLRTEEKAVQLVKAFADAGKPIFAICHGPWTLIEAGAVRDRKMTSWPSLKTDIENAGGHWEDSAVVVDNGLVTSRKPDDIPQFVDKAIEELLEPQHRSARAE